MKAAIGFCALMWGLIGLILLVGSFVPGGGIMVACHRYEPNFVSEDRPPHRFEMCRAFLGRDRLRAQELRERWEQENRS